MIIDFTKLNRDLLDVDWQVLQNRGVNEIWEVFSFSLDKLVAKNTREVENIEYFSIL